MKSKYSLLEAIVTSTNSEENFNNALVGFNSTESMFFIRMPSNKVYTL